MDYLTDGLWLKQEHIQLMLAEVNQKAPEEACGLIAGQGNKVESVYAVTNSLHSPYRFRMDAQEQVNAFLEIERRGWELQAIFHSHPAGPATPSPTDLNEFAYPGVVYLIWWFSDGEWYVQGYLLDQDNVLPVQVRVTE